MACDNLPTRDDLESLKENIPVIDEFVESDKETLVTPDGKEKMTISGIEKYGIDTIKSIEETAAKSYVGAWERGVTTFTTMNEYTEFNGVSYKPKSGIALPYVAQTDSPLSEPDVSNVEPFVMYDYGTIESGQTVKHRRGTNDEIMANVPALGELWFNTTDGFTHVGDGVRRGGIRQSSVFASVIDLRKSLLATGTLVETKSYHNYSTADTVGAAKYKIVSALEYSGTPDEQGDHTLANGNIAKLITDGVIDVTKFGATNRIDEVTGAAVNYSDSAFSAAQTAAYGLKLPVHHPSGIYRLSNNYVIKVKSTGDGKESTTILFDSGHGFRTYDSVALRYFVPEISGIHFASDKEPSWNAVDAGESYVEGIANYFVRLKYGQRVAKGNKTTTPNNILATDPQDQQDGTGFWNKDYSQWVQTDGTEVDLTGVALNYTDDSNQIYTFSPSKVVQKCKFSGFTHGLVLAGVIEETVELNDFVTCNVGLYTNSASFIGGSSAERITTISVSKNVFEDLDVGIYAHTMLQSTIKDGNVFQPVKVGVYAGGGGIAGTEINNNYFEVGHTFFYHLPNLAMYGSVRNNFTNASYSRYLAWCNNGQKMRFLEPQSTFQKVHFNAGVQTSEVNSGFLLDVSSTFFRQNDNIVDGGKAKECIVRVTGVGGTTFTITKEWSSVETEDGVGIFPELTSSQSGLNFPGSSRPIFVDLMSGHSTSTYFGGDGPDPERAKVYYFWDIITNTDIDLREDGVTRTIKIIWTEF